MIIVRPIQNVVISIEPLIPKNLPLKPENNEPRKGKKIIVKYKFLYFLTSFLKLKFFKFILILYIYYYKTIYIIFYTII